MRLLLLIIVLAVTFATGYTVGRLAAHDYSTMVLLEG